MKNILLLLLISASAFGQNPTPNQNLGNATLYTIYIGKDLYKTGGYRYQDSRDSVALDSTIKAWVTTQMVNFIPWADTVNAGPVMTESKAESALAVIDASKFDNPIGNSSQYLDGTGVPTAFPAIPAIQLKSDWNESDTTQKDWIRNKPVVPTNNNQLTNGNNYLVTPGGSSTQVLNGAGSSVNFSSLFISTAVNYVLGNISFTITPASGSPVTTTPIAVGDVYSGSSYSNPSWITSLAYAKLTGVPAFITGNQTVTLTGDVGGSGPTAITTTLSATGVAAGTYNTVTVDTKGRVTAGNVATPATATRALNSNFQPSTTQGIRCTYSITHTLALSLVVSSGSSSAFLEISANGSTGWVTICQGGITETLTVGVGVNKTSTTNLQGEVPIGYFVRIRTTVAGGGSAAYTCGQETPY